MKSISLKSYAKINIALNCYEVFDGEHHRLDMVMLPLELHDSIIAEKLPVIADNYVTIDDYSLGVIKYNIATAAIELLQKKYGFQQTFDVFIHKNIPIRAGLGGGSSNAAFTIKAINSLMKLGMSRDEMLEAAKQLGADVAFFVDCVPARAQGYGEILMPITIKNNYYVLLVKPKEGCSTKEVFNKTDELEVKTYDIDAVIEALENGDDDKLAPSIGNSLEDAAFEIVPQIKQIKDKLKSLGLKIVLMSGSGSSVFAMSTNLKELRKAADQFDDKECFVEITKIKKK